MKMAEFLANQPIWLLHLIPVFLFCIYVFIKMVGNKTVKTLVSHHLLF